MLRNKLKWWGQNKNKRKPCRHCLLHATSGQGWWWWAIVPLNWDGGGKIKTRGKLTVTAFYMHQVDGDGGDGPWLIEGGRPAWPTEQQLNWKCWEKIGMVGKIKQEETSLSPPISRTGRQGWWWWAIGALIDWGRATSVANWITI